MEDEKEQGLNYEQKRWEEERLSAALVKYGARDAKDQASKKVPPPLVLNLAFIFLSVEKKLLPTVGKSQG